MSRIYIESKRQELRYLGTAEKIWWPSVLDGKRINLTTAPKIALYDASGTVLLAATNMTQAAVVSEGYLDYDARTAAFSVGATLTGGTSTATGKIKSVRTNKAKTGTIQLTDIVGTFTNNETITDNGVNTGSATADGATDAAYSALWCYSWNCAAEEIGDNYSGIVTFSYSSVDYTESPLYFDIVYAPFEPFVTSQDIDERHPEWLSSRDEYWEDWWPIIKHGHAALAARLRSLGKRGSLLIDRGQLYPVELAFVESEFAQRAGKFSKEDRDFYLSKANEALASAQPFQYRVDDADSVDDMGDDSGVVLGCRFTR